MPVAGEQAPLLRPVILEAKLHPPTPRPEHVSRPHLLRMLDDGAARPLTLVAAPAGFGKSTLLAEWCAQGAGGRRSTWVSLDEGDNDPVVFWSYVLHALQRVVPAGFDAGQAALARPGVSLTRTVLPGLLNELWSLSEPLVVVLDDYHELTNAECHASLEFFLRRLPPSIHLVIATRSDPPLGLAALRVRGNLTELRASALRFNIGEAGALLNDRLALNLTEPDLTRLTDRTEGWAAGLYLAALSLQGRPDASAFIAAFAGDHRYLVDYLSGEVLDRLSAETRTFLVRSSILESFSAPLCNAVTGLADGAERLLELKRTNQFLIGLDDRGEWYRYHHLFAELLRMELVLTEPELAPELHRRAAVWYRSDGNAIAAMRHALAAPDYTLAGSLFVTQWQRTSSRGRFATVMGWLEQFPDAAFKASASLALAAASVLVTARRPWTEVERYLALVGDAEADGPLPLGAHSIRSAVALMRAAIPYDDVDLALSAARTAVAAETDPRRHTYQNARMSLGQALYLSGRPAEARAPLEAAIGAPLAAEQPASRIIAIAYLGLVWLAEGAVDRAEKLAQQAMQEAATVGLTEHPGLWHAPLALGRVLLHQGRIEEATAVLVPGLEHRLNELQHTPLAYAFALLTLASLRQAQGHGLAARSLIDEVQGVVTRCADAGILSQLLEEHTRIVKPYPHRPAALHEDLTESELRVLRLLTSDLSQREIGRELYLSQNTVKTHTRAIYGKLGASSRDEAVARARALGLIA